MGRSVHIAAECACPYGAGALFLCSLAVVVLCSNFCGIVPLAALLLLVCFPDHLCVVSSMLACALGFARFGVWDVRNARKRDFEVILLKNGLQIRSCSRLEVGAHRNLASCSVRDQLQEKVFRQTARSILCFAEIHHDVRLISDFDLLPTYHNFEFRPQNPTT